MPSRQPQPPKPSTAAPTPAATRTPADTRPQTPAGRITPNSSHKVDPQRPSRPTPARAGRITPNGSQFFDPRRGWDAVTRVVTLQHGVITLHQLIEAGLGRSTISRYNAVGWLHRIHHGVYALTPPALLRPNGRQLAAVLACGPGAALSHRAAAAQHELLTWTGTTPDVTVPTHAGHRRPGIKLHRSTTLRPEDVTTVNGIPATSPSRTLVDLADVLAPKELDRALDRAIALNRFDRTALHDQLAHNHARSRATAHLSRALASHRLDTLPTWNDFEDLFLDLIRTAGLPEPEVQPWLDLNDDESPIQPDFLWRSERLIVETDGWQFHGTRTSFEQDRRRDQRAIAAGYRTVRVTWSQLREEPARLTSTLRTAAAASARASLVAWAA